MPGPDPVDTPAPVLTHAEREAENRRYLLSLMDRGLWLSQLRPRKLGSLLLGLAGLQDKRRIIQTDMGVRLYVDPLTDLGRPIVVDGVYEADTVQIFKDEIEAGQVVMDVGANEGLFSTLAGVLVGPTGSVIAVEPQLRLQDIIEINLRINQITWGRIYQNALGGAEGEIGAIYLYASVDTGMSSVVRGYRSTTGRQNFRYVSVERIMREARIRQFDFVKVDVEGFEHKVVEALLPHMSRGEIRKLLLDYHSATLSKLGVSPKAIHEALLGCGMRVTRGNENVLDSYLLYESTRSLPT